MYMRVAFIFKLKNLFPTLIPCSLIDLKRNWYFTHTHTETDLYSKKVYVLLLVLHTNIILIDKKVNEY